jgi:predicted metal-dependent phosphoesterase TrpH
LHGAEVSVRYEDVELHMLVYFPSEMPADFRDFCRGQAQGRANRYEYIREGLHLSGIPAATEEARRGESSLTRFHLAQALVAAGHVGSVDAAFRDHLSRKRGLLPPLELTIEEAIERARSSGGITSWAHPPIGWATEWARPLKKLGLHALEGVRPRMGARTGAP